MNDYPAIRLFLRLGWYLAFLIVGAIWCVVAWALTQGMFGVVGAVIGIVSALIVGFLVIVLVDLIRLITDMLVPQ